MSSFKIIGLLVLKEKIFLRFFVIYSHGGHLGHVTMTVYANFHSLFMRMLHIKFGFDNLIRQAVLEKTMFEYFGHIHVYSPGLGTDIRLGLKYYHKLKYSVHFLIPSKFSAIKTHFHIFPHSNAWAT